MRILLFVLTFLVCSCASGPYNNNSAWFAGQSANDAANAASQAASQPMFTPAPGGF